MKDNNGKHGINGKKAKEWINAQPINEARHIAQKIIDSTIYVTFDEVHEYIEKLIISSYKKIHDDKNNEIHMYIGEPNKSNYFLSLLGLYYIKKHKYREPSKYFSRIPENSINDNDTIGKKPVLVYIDDKTYLGGQIIHLIISIVNNIYNSNLRDLLTNKFGSEIVKLYDTREFDKLLDIINAETKSNNGLNNFKQDYQKVMKDINYYKIEFLLLGVNKIALERLIDNDYNAIYQIYNHYLDIKESKNLPFKINYNFHYSKNYKTINEIFTEEEQFHLGYYFSIGRLPNVLVYFDYKIADDTSTILKILNYGPIVPDNYNISNYWSDFRYILKQSTNKFIQDNYYIAPNTKYFYNLAHKYYSNINVRKYQDINKPIKFIPFINNCKNINNIINNKLLKYINYVMFMTINNIGTPSFYKTRAKMINMPMFSNIDLLNKFINDDILQQKINDFLIQINEQRCELSFYKTWDWKVKKTQNISMNKYIKKSKKKPK